MRGRVEVLFLDDDDDLREAMVDLLGALGHECLCLASFEELVALGDRVDRCGLAVLDINLGPGVGSGIDAFRWLRARAFAGEIVFLTGHGHEHPLVAEASRLGEARVLQKPVTTAVLREVVDGVGERRGAR